MRGLKIILAFLFLFSGFAKSQENTLSPFSRIGIGELQQPSFSQNFAMGGLSYGVQSNYNINTVNPASYSRLFWTSFEAAVISNNSWLETGSQTQNSNVTNFNHLALGFPIAPWWGMAFAIMPVSKVGYNYETSHTYQGLDSSTITYDNEFIGTGGVNKVLLGHGFSVQRRFFFGFNFAYYFGDMEYQETINFTSENTFNNSASLERVEVGDIFFDFGFQYRANMGKDWRVDLGAAFTPFQNLNSKQSRFDFTYVDQRGTAAIIDTVSFNENSDFRIVLPPKYGFGAVFNKGDKIRAGFDIDYTLWSLSNYNTYGGLEDVFMIRTGFEANGKDNRIIYRFGARYGELPIVLNNSRSDEMALTAGIAFPFRSKDKLSYTVLNIGVEVGQRGKIEDQWLQERFINVNVGLTLNNKWFIKRVYD